MRRVSLQPAQAQPPAQCGTDSTCDGRAQCQTGQNAPTHVAEALLAHRVEPWPGPSRTQHQRSHSEVEPVKGHVGEGVADQGGSGGQKMVAPQQGRHTHAEDDLQPEEGKAAAEDASAHTTGPLSWRSLLVPDPGDRSSHSGLHILQEHPGHGCSPSPAEKGLACDRREERAETGPTRQ